jgi:hypothetical protein
MKRVCALVLAVLLVFTGCTGGIGTKNVSVKDVCCPYEIVHKKGTVQLTLKDGDEKGILWQVEAVPAELCTVTQDETEKEYTSRYSINGNEEGTAQLTFTAQQEDASVVFVLDLMVAVNAEGEVAVTSCSHRERTDVAVEADGLSYEWNVDVNGILHFAFIESEDNWSVKYDDESVCTLVDKMATSGGCQFSLQAISAGQTAIRLVGKDTQRQINVTVQVDDAGKMEVVSVQEQ